MTHPDHDKGMSDANLIHNSIVGNYPASQETTSDLLTLKGGYFFVIGVANGTTLATTPNGT